MRTTPSLSALHIGFFTIALATVTVLGGAAAGCSAEVTESGTDPSTTASTGDQQSTSGGTGGGDPTMVTTASSSSGGVTCDGDQLDLCPGVGSGFVIRWGDVPMGGVSGGSSTATGGGPNPDDLLVVIYQSPTNPLTCAEPFGPSDACVDYSSVSFTVHPDDLDSVSLIDLASVNALSSMETSECEGGGGTVSSGKVGFFHQSNGVLALNLLGDPGQTTLESGKYELGVCPTSD
ncbi:MAG TPA: hypothetical protein VGM56_06225 [Byssovorax sp.]|jgi:hypothetical protein